MIGNNDQQPMLSGVKIVDLTSVVFGPYCTQILADLGAEVIKVETPGVGDAFRWSGKSAVSKGMAPGFLAINRGKQSVALDLKQSADLATMKQFLADADVFILNVRGRAVERLGLDYEMVKNINPQIIYAHCVGFGQDGPYADLQAYDDVIQAASGAATIVQRVDAEKPPTYFPSLIADKVAGLHGAYGVLAAIIHKMRTGLGQKVEIPMFEAFTNFMMLEHLSGLTFDPPNGPVCYARQTDPDRQPFPTSDGYISIVAYNDEAWPIVFGILGDRSALDDERFSTRALRATNIGSLYQKLAALTPNFTTAQLLEKCHAAQIPAQAVRDIADVMEDPHLKATGFFKSRQHPDEGAYFQMRQPVSFSGAKLDDPLHPPRLDQDGEKLRAGG